MLLETMVDCGWWDDCCGGKIFFNFFALLKKVPKITNEKKRPAKIETKKKRPGSPLFLILLHF
jgi:hypothetical protein